MIKERTMHLIAPLLVILCGNVTAIVFSKFIGCWAFIPLALVYWGVSFSIAYKALGKEGISEAFKKPQGGIRWLILALIVALLPAIILIQNYSLFTPGLVVITAIFISVNPFFEEIFWRAYLLQKLPFGKVGAAFFSTILFVGSHPLMWGVFSIANRDYFTFLSLLIMGSVWSVVYYKTKSLWWCIVSHLLVDIFNLAVLVFLNIYIPSGFR